MMIWRLAASFLLCQAVNAACPADWVQNGQSCYFVSSLFNVPLSWHEAVSQCDVWGGYLAIINDADENSFILAQVKAFGERGPHWIGLHDLYEQDTFEWVDGSPVTYAAWASGEPNNYEDRPGFGEDCVELYPGDGLWNDQNCAGRTYYVCERDINAAPSKNCDEDNGWKEYNGRCYQSFTTTMTWQGANQACKAIDSDLVAISDATEQIVVSNEANLINQILWIGLSSVNHENNQLYWSNEKDQYTEGVSYNNWLNGQTPTLETSASNCVELQTSASAGGPWNVLRCGELRGYMCETSFTGTCADGWYLFNGQCYLIAATPELWTNWESAVKYCDATGGSLLQIDDDREEGYIKTRLQEIKDAGSPGVWLGVSDSETDGTFKWIDGTLDSERSYRIWSDTQPLDRPSAWDCGQVFSGSLSGVWETEDCFVQQAFMCEIATGVDVKPVDPVAQTHKGCEPNWLWYNNHCYFFEYGAPTQWQTAENICVNYGGHLTSILDGDENSFVTGHSNGDTWFGATDSLSEGNWQWTDSSPWQYSNFQDGEPNASGNCGQFWSGNGYRWDDLPCTESRHYVCKKAETDCFEALGVEDYRIKDSQMTASSQWDSSFAPYYARLNIQKGQGNNACWAPLDVTPGTQWIQVELRERQTISAVVTQGRPSDVIQYIKTFNLQTSSDGKKWDNVQDDSGATKLFNGNTDHYTAITNKLPSPVVTKHLRLIPQDFEGHPSLRMEVLGCSRTGDELPTPSPDKSCTSINVADRLDCGYAGITDGECSSKGCCYDNTISDAPFCFYKKGDYDPRCGKDFVFGPNEFFYCYRFTGDKLRNWDEAREYCRSYGGDLLSINSKEEAAFVSSQLTSLVLTPSLWIGANTLDATQGWQWSDQQPFNYINWAPGEPNNASPDANEHCAEMYTSSSQWNDVACSGERGIACKKFAIIAPPIPDIHGNIHENICEGETGILGCVFNEVIVVHHASYGRSNRQACSSDQNVPIGGCKAENSLDIVSEMCNYKLACTLTASNEVFGDPCNGVYKYLDVIYSCEHVACYEPLGVENGTVSDSQITESSFSDSNHRGVNGRLNSPTSWATNEGVGAYVQVTFNANIRISGLSMQGAGDAQRWVTTFKVALATDPAWTKWEEYTDYDKNVMVFSANTDATTAVRVVLAEHVYTSGIRILPLTWSGDMIGMRFDLTGCQPYRELNCFENGDVFYDRDDDLGTSFQADCPGGCPITTFPPLVYGTDIYAGNSQICNAAVHAGVLTLPIGGAVTLVNKAPLSSYPGTDHNQVVSQDLDYYPIAFAFANNKKTCEAGWIPYEARCFLVSADVLNWPEADATCKAIKSELVSIVDTVDNDFVWQLLAPFNYSSMWTGLNDLRSLNEYEWSDGLPVTWTNWRVGEPNNYEGKQESCVELYKDDGRWNDALCTDEQPYICTKQKGYYSADQTEDPTPAPGCPDGWAAYQATCYWFERTRMTESDGEAFCASQGGQHVHIQDKFVQSFLHTIIGVEDQRWWIGLHGHVDESGSSWEWESGDPVYYDNWGYGNPSIEFGECTVFYGGQVGNGMWFSHRCDSESFSVCELPRDGYTAPPEVTPPPSGGCPHDWSTPDDNMDGYCYKVFTPPDDDDDISSWKQKWSDARQQCLSYQGDLASIHDKSEETHLLTEVLRMGVESQPLWIGLNNLGQVDWEWSDKSAVSFVNWKVGFPSSVNDNKCVSFVFESETGTAKWQNLNCLERFNWICKRVKGIDIVEPTAPPTGTPNPQCGSEDDGTWLEYNNMCYLFNDVAEVDVYTAQTKCNEFGGELASIHDYVEQAFIANQIQIMKGGQDKFWLGLREYGGLNGEYLWSDNTALDYVNWNSGEPNDAGGIEQCVVAYKSNGKWNDANCGLTLFGYVCKTYIGSPPKPPTSPPPITGGCPSGWYMYSDYCYKIHGQYPICDTEESDNEQCTATWTRAQAICEKDGGWLTSIHNKWENAFLAGIIISSNHDSWIGLSDIQWWKTYTWANNDQVVYTNWNQGEPSKSDKVEECVEFYKTEPIVGRWNDNKCDQTKPYICQKMKDPQLKTGNEVNSNRNCPSGWLEYDTFAGDYVCYYLDTTERTFDDARTNCQSLGADLVSIQSLYDQNIMTSYIKDTSAWIGLQLNPDDYQWQWTDGWPVWVTNWGEGMPGSDVTQACAVTKNAQFGSEWVTATCSQKFASVCKTSTESIPSTPGYVDGYCADPSWQEYGGFCYFYHVIQGTEELGLPWNEAKFECEKHSGTLVTFGSRQELEWVLSWYNYTESLWIGLLDNGNGGWTWVDNRPVDFTYWNNGEPNNFGENGEDCVEMNGDNGRWNDNDCSATFGYMCRVPKVIGTDGGGGVVHYTTPAHPDTSKTNGSSAGIVIGVIAGVAVALILIAGLAIYFKCIKAPPAVSKMGESVSDFSKGIVNKLYFGSPGESSAHDGGPVHFDKDSGADAFGSEA